MRPAWRANTRFAPTIIAFIGCDVVTTIIIARYLIIRSRGMPNGHWETTNIHYGSGTLWAGTVSGEPGGATKEH